MQDKSEVYYPLEAWRNVSVSIHLISTDSHNTMFCAHKHILVITRYKLQSANNEIHNALAVKVTQFKFILHAIIHGVQSPL